MFEIALEPVFSILAALGLVAVNAMWVAAEFAIVRVRRTRLEELSGEGVAAAKDAIVVIDRMNDYLAVTQIGVTVASLGVGWLAEDAFAQLFVSLLPAEAETFAFVHTAAAVGAFLLATALLVLLGELVPKNVAVRNAEHLLLSLAVPLRVAHFVLRPALRVLERLSTWVLHRMGHGTAVSQPLTEKELKLILAESHKGGIVSDGEAQIIIRAFEFADKQSEAIMIPAEDVCYISLERSVEHNLETAQKHMHARLPVCRSGLDSVIGTVSMKDAWPVLECERSNAAFERACRPPIFIPLDFTQDDILQAFRARRGQMGIVRDLAGKKTLGIVTLEDVLESLVGDVREYKCSGIGCSLAAAIKDRSHAAAVAASQSMTASL
jgi:CBS domain containing-hemolysin-like protein